MVAVFLISAGLTFLLVVSVVFARREKKQLDAEKKRKHYDQNAKKADNSIETQFMHNPATQKVAKGEQRKLKSKKHRSKKNRKKFFLSFPLTYSFNAKNNLAQNIRTNAWPKKTSPAIGQRRGDFWFVRFFGRVIPLRARFAFALLMALIVCLFMVVLGYLSMLRILPYEHDMYDPLEFLSTDVLSQALLGAVFGALAAFWTMRVYREKQNALTTLQKAEAVVILLLFVLGATPASLEKILSGLKINGVGMSLEFAALTPRKIDNKEAPTLNVVRTGGDGPQRVIGLSLLTFITTGLKRDRGYLEIFVENKDTAKTHARFQQEFDKQIAPIFACIAKLGSEFGDPSIFFEHLTALRPYVRSIQLHLERDKSGPHEDNKSSPAHHTFSYARAELNRKIKELIAVSKSIHKLIPNEKSHPCGNDKLKNASIPASLEHASVTARPYFAAILSSLLYLDNQPDLALAVLDDVIENLGKSKKNSREKPTPRDAAFWYRLRALTLYSFLAQNYYSTNGGLPAQTRDTYIKHLSEQLRMISEIDVKIPDRSLFPSESILGKTLLDRFYIRTADKIKQCPTENDFRPNNKNAKLSIENAARMGFVYLQTADFLARQLIDHPEFSTNLSRRANQLVDLTTNTSLTCLIYFEQLAKKKISRPHYFEEKIIDFLYTYSLYQIKHAQTRKPATQPYKENIKKRLTLARNVANLALEKVKWLQTELKDPQRILDKREDLKRLQTLTRRWLERL